VDKFIVFDIETDGLLDAVSKIHCVCYDNFTEKGSLTEETEIKNLFSNNKSYFVGHNIIQYDLVVLNRLLGIKVSKIIDTYPLSCALFPERQEHGLESWGETFGFPKVKIQSWTDQSLSDYVERCERDVHINTLLFRSIMAKLTDLYGE
jgi:DNA polymerase III alpha subunit (gram-positive type)